MHFWPFVTDYGDSAVTPPLALVTLAFLGISGAFRHLWAWLIAVAVCGGTMVQLKVGLGACWPFGPAHRNFSPSGHTAMSVLVYGGVALLATHEASARLQYATIGGALVVAVVIAVSRLLVHAHTPVGGVIGFAVGSASLALLMWLSRHLRMQLVWRRFAVVAALVIVVMHGTRWPIEGHLQEVAGFVRQSVPMCE